MCFILMFVCETLDMSSRRVHLSQLKNDLDDVHETLTDVAAILQQQAEADTSGRTPSENVK